MRVAFDATPVITGRTGIARYVTRLGAALEAVGVDVRRFAIGRAPIAPPAGVRRLPVPLRVVSRSWLWGGPPWPEWLTGRVDVVHATSLMPPPSRHPVVATVHDLNALERPDLHPPRSVRNAEALVSRLGRARLVLADSHTTAAALVRHGLEGDRVIVTYPGVTPLPPPQDPGVEPGYLLAVGEVHARKGLATILQALAVEPARHLRLVHAGPPGPGSDDVERRIVSLRLGDRARLLGPVSDGVLAGLYRDAAALCFPSHGEGFGFPVLEAMAAGLPVVASDIDIMQEVAGDAALLVDVDAPGAWAESLAALVDDPLERARLAAAGQDRAAEFTWERTAAETLAAYHRAVDRP